MHQARAGEIFHGQMKGERARAEGERSDRGEQSEVSGSFFLRLGAQDMFDTLAMGRCAKMCFPPRAGSSFPTIISKACGADDKERVAHAIHKLKVLVHAVGLPAVLLEPRNARVTSRRDFSWTDERGKEPSQTDKGAT